jgi:uncharacterized membrane protein YqaE (UPF0057 family)
MSFVRGLACVVFPPAAVVDKGCGAPLVVGVLTLLGWVPGVFAALILVVRDNERRSSDRPVVMALLAFVVVVGVLVWSGWTLLTVGVKENSRLIQESVAQATAQRDAEQAAQATVRRDVGQATQPQKRDPLAPGSTVRLAHEVVVNIPHGTMKFPAGLECRVVSVDGERVEISSGGFSGFVNRSDIEH